MTPAERDKARAEADRHARALEKFLPDAALDLDIPNLRVRDFTHEELVAWILASPSP